VKLDIGAREFIESQRVARLGTVDGRSRPHVVPICFALVGDALYSVIDEKPKRGEPGRLRRVRNIASHPQVQVLFDRYDDGDWSALRFVQVRGRARVLTSGDEYERALAALRGRYRQYNDMALSGRPVIAVDIDGVVAWP
jgi:PPOX class probable F420-dependent enzyme